MTLTTPGIVDLPVDRWHTTVAERAAGGDRFAGVYCAHRGENAQLHALLVGDATVDCIRAVLTADRNGALTYSALTPEVPAAFWYERALHDLSGVIPIGHPRLDPLLLPREQGQEAPRPGGAAQAELDRHVHSSATERHGPVDVHGRGVFSLPLGPVRSGVYESIEYLIETTGESIPHLNIRPHYKHRGIAKRFEGLAPENGILVAERVEGVASVAHALAFAHAVETLAGVAPPRAAGLVRVIHAELERIANHLDVVVRLCDAAGLGVPTARFGWHKEQVLRLVSAMCGNRFGRSVVRVGGVSGTPRLSPTTISDRLAAIVARVRVDGRSLMRDASFLDRLRGTGPLDTELAASHGALGPVGRGSGCTDDARNRSYDGYLELPPVNAPVYYEGDALARLRVRWDEIDGSAASIRQACDRLLTLADAPTCTGVPAVDGYALGWAEAPHGELLYGLEMRGGTVERCFARTASLHNLLLFHDVFAGDIFTDFPFIEASFGACYAGVAM